MMWDFEDQRAQLTGVDSQLPQPLTVQNIFGEAKMKLSSLSQNVSRIAMSAVAISSLGLSGAAYAQDAEGEGGEEADTGNTIVVTAQRREQNLQDVPIAVTAVGSEALIQSGTTDLQDLTALTPGLTGKNQGLASAIYSIRGINSNSFGVGGDNSVGIFVDEVFIGRQAISNIGFLDAERVEVLKGPQGTLFGRNSTAGAISITSKKPGNDFEGEARISYGDRDGFDANTFEAFGAISIPVVEDVFSVRIAGQRQYQDGTWTNVATGERAGDNEVWSGRITGVLNVTDTLSVTGFYSIFRQDTTGFPWGTTNPDLVALAPGSSTDPFDRLVAFDTEQFERRDADVAGLTVEWEISPDVSIKSITSFTSIDDQGVTDLDGSILPIVSANFGPDPAAVAANPGFTLGSDDTTFSQELRLSGSTDKLDWLIGVSYFEEDIDDPITFGFNDNFLVGGTPIPADTFFPGQPAFGVCDATSDGLLGPCNPNGRESVLIGVESESYAIFGDARYQFNDALALTVGLRYSRDEKQFTFTSFIEPSVAAALFGGSVVFPDTGAQPITFEDDWNDLQPRFVLDYKVSDDVLTYASISRGFKAGGFDISQVQANIPFDEESVWAYEVGVKSQLGGLATFNLAAYFNDYSGLQVQTTVGGITQTVNVPTLDSYGFEAELYAEPLDGLDVTLGVAFNESEFGTFVIDDIIAMDGSTVDLAGNRVPQTSRWSLNAVAQYTHALSDNLDLYVRGDANFRSREFETIENLDQFSQEGFWLANARIGLNDANRAWEVALFVQNLFDKEYVNFRNNLGFGTVEIAAEPRTFGIQVLTNF